MAVFVHPEFLKKFIEIEDYAYQKKDKKKIRTLLIIETLFEAMKAIPIIDYKELVKIFKKEVSPQKLEEHEQRILNLYNQSFSNRPDIVVNSNSDFYFLNELNASLLEKEFGVLAKGLDFDGTDFYNKASHAVNLPLNRKKKKENTNSTHKYWDEFREFILPSNGILIIDPYIFGEPYEDEKRVSLKEFIALIKSDIRKEYHITIITSIPKDFPLERIDTALEAFKEEKICVEIYACNQDKDFIKKYGKTRDREFFTNYSTITIGHPFDKKETKISQNFLGYGDDINQIKKNCDNYQRDLKKWLKIINDIKKIEETTGKILYWRTNEFINRLFENIQ